MAKTEVATVEQKQGGQEITAASSVTQADMLLATVQSAVADGRDPDTIDRLLASVERVMDRKAKEDYFRAFHLARSEMKPVGVRGMNKHTRTAFPLLEDIQAMADPIIGDYGFRMSFWSDVSPRGENWVRVMLKITHIGGHEEIFHTDLPEDKAGAQGTANKSDVQAIGSTETYGQRYLYTKVWNIRIAKNPLDDDGEGSKPVECITENQAADLKLFLEDVKVPVEEFLKRHKCKSLELLPKAVYPLAINQLENRRKRMQEQGQ